MGSQQQQRAAPKSISPHHSEWHIDIAHGDRGGELDGASLDDWPVTASAAGRPSSRPEGTPG